MIHQAIAVLRSAGLEAALLQVLIRADLPVGYRGMSLADGAALGAEAFSSPAMLNHVLEEELLHLRQRERGRAGEFAPGMARQLESEVDAERRFPLPEERPDGTAGPAPSSE